MKEEIEIIDKVNDVLKTFIKGINDKFKEIDSRLTNISIRRKGKIICISEIFTNIKVIFPGVEL